MMKMTNSKIRKIRQKHRKKSFKKGKPTLSQKEYRERIKIHYKTLKKYLEQFRKYLNFYILESVNAHLLINMLLGEKNVTDIQNGKRLPSINEIYKLFDSLPLKDGFSNYLINKTHFSYSVDKNPIVCEVDKKRYKYVEYNKFAEFIYLILAEYVILHNYMWASGIKPKEVKSIDNFLK